VINEFAANKACGKTRKGECRKNCTYLCVIDSEGASKERQGGGDDSKANCNKEGCENKNTNLPRKFREGVGELVFHRYITELGLTERLAGCFITSRCIVCICA